MKVLHISTNAYGGAGIAATRQHMALKVSGVDSSILFLRGSNNNVIGSYFLSENPTLLKRVLSKLGISKLYLSRITDLKKQIGYEHEFISLPFSDVDVTQFCISTCPQIVNIHWVAGFVDYRRFFNLVNCPIVLTLHDMNPFMGIFHYSDDYDRATEIGKLLDNVYAKYKLQIYKKARSLHFVAPSIWMKDVFEHSLFGCEFPVHYIPSSLDTHIFTFKDKEAARYQLQLPQDKKILLFISDYLENPRKGFYLLTEALRLLSGDNYLLVCVGKANPEQLQHIPNLRFVGPIFDDLKMNLFYAAADYFVMPSLQDNLPNVMLESLCSGTPVICYNSGGAIDFVENSINGYIVREKTPEALADVIVTALSSNQLKCYEEISKHASIRLSPRIQAEAYKNLYASLL